MLLLQTHYRSPVKVGQDNIDAAVNSLAGLDGFANRMASAYLPATASDETVLAQFRSHMDNDLDSPSAMALIFDAVRRANIAAESGDNTTTASLANAVHEMCNALGLKLRAGDDIDDAIVERANALDAARKAKDFAQADAIRNELQAAGYVVETTKDGTRVRRS
jgi:cysteinyl-tRNA synthetase